MQVFQLSSDKLGTCGDAQRAMFLSTGSLAREGDLQGLENTGLLVIRAGEARDAVGVVQGIGQQTEAVERVKRIRQCDPVRVLFRGAERRRQAPLYLPTEFQGQHTHEHVAPGAGFLAHKEWAYFEEPRFQRPQVSLDVR